MDLLAYWRLDNYKRDLDAGAGFNFNSSQSRLHSAIEIGERLWLVTKIVTAPGRAEFRLVAKLVVRSKTINPPDYKYGPFRVWGHLEQSRYFEARAQAEDDTFELLRLLPLESRSLAECTRTNLPQFIQTMRGLTPKASRLLETFCVQLPIETRARMVADELRLEHAIEGGDREAVESIIREEHVGASEKRREELLRSYTRNRQLTARINDLYGGRCQLCGFDSPVVYNTPSAEAHHIVYRSRGGNDTLENLALVCQIITQSFIGLPRRSIISGSPFVFQTAAWNR